MEEQVFIVLTEYTEDGETFFQAEFDQGDNTVITGIVHSCQYCLVVHVVEVLRLMNLYNVNQLVCIQGDNGERFIPLAHCFACSAEPVNKLLH